MPPRTAKKSPTIKSTAKAKKAASASESSPAVALLTVTEETMPEPDALCTRQNDDASETDAVCCDDLEKREVPPSPAIVEELAEPVSKDSNPRSKSEASLEDKRTEEDDGVNDVVDKLEMAEGVKIVDKISARDEIECEATGADDTDDVDGGDDRTDDTDLDNEENEDDHTLDMQAALAEGKKQKESEIFVGGLDKGAVEDDLIKVFSVFGDVQSARIVRHPASKKSKGFAFIRFANSEHTLKTLAELKDGTEINGKHVRVQASQDNDTLYLGNISKTWTRDDVIERLKSFGLEQIDNLNLPEDPKNEGKNKGFAFLEFNSHSDAILAFQRLRKPDADFGRDRTAKVAFAHSSVHPSEEDLLQVKTVYFEGIPLSWDEEKVREICKEFGQIEKVLLSRNFSSRRRKDFGFVEFSSRDSALDCIEGIKIAQITDGDSKVTAELARPVNRGRLSTQGSKGGFKVKKDGETNQEVGGSVKKRRAKLVNILPKEKKHNAKVAEVPKKRDTNRKNGMQMTFSTKRKISTGKAMERPSKKMRPYRSYGNSHNQHISGFGNHKRTYSAIRERSYGGRSSAYPSRYASSSTSCEGYLSEPQIHPSDLVPHAGYLPSLRQGRSTFEYDQRREPRSSFRSGRENFGAPAPYQSDYSSFQRAAAYGHHDGRLYDGKPYEAPQGPYYYH